jgi:hypothetical protein
VFRAALLSIVLSLAIGQDLTLLCSTTWCDAKVAVGSECHHKSSSHTPNVAGDKRCDNVEAGVAATLREDVRRGVPFQDANHVVPVPRFQLVQLTTDVRRGQEPWRKSSVERPALPTTLRI